MSNLKVGRPINRKNKAIELVEDIQKKNIRMNINISNEFYKKIKQRAINEDTSITEIVKKALVKYMAK